MTLDSASDDISADPHGALNDDLLVSVRTTCGDNSVLHIWLTSDTFDEARQISQEEDLQGIARTSLSPRKLPLMSFESRHQRHPSTT